MQDYLIEYAICVATDAHDSEDEIFLTIIISANSQESAEAAAESLKEQAFDSCPYEESELDDIGSYVTSLSHYNNKLRELGRSMLEQLPDDKHPQD